ncbi:hypothetical protein OCS_02259 [Ophiocordyceps sinensis CO18]|uniref:Ecp2 effector protein domain-containing protein n=1 Tax=Ophiocordyceps sinensis (strain Co18 / CGMCC 3.14243) TaxID=911162 RepID=T5AHG8_OPHSC|nr:hypothetical protein OCS_02259 [Ophiocordyceps sinensis CO18]
MRAIPILCSIIAVLGSASATCSEPEPAEQICYNRPDATPQNIDLKDIGAAAQRLRLYHASQIRKHQSPFWKMKVADADNCAEWRAMTAGGAWVLVKLVGERDAAVTFKDIANTLTQGQGLVNCGAAGGQMGVIVDGGDALYASPEFVSGGYTTEGLLVKVVRGP